MMHMCMPDSFHIVPVEEVVDEGAPVQPSPFVRNALAAGPSREEAGGSWVGGGRKRAYERGEGEGVCGVKEVERAVTFTASENDGADVLAGLLGG